MTLTHPLDRPNQLETAKRNLQSDKKFVIDSAPTGSGKSAYADYAVSEGYKTLVLVKTKSLQKQYEAYNFTSITGKSDYRCCGFGQQVDLFDGHKIPLTADLCEVPNELYQECKFNCEYPRAREKFVNSRAGVTNYAKFLSDRKLIDDFNPDILFLDEGHELADNIVIDRSGLTYNWKHNKRVLDYTDQITIELDDSIPLPMANRKTLNQGRKWLQTFSDELGYNPPIHPSKGGDARLYKWHKNQMDKIDLTLACMDIEKDVWFVRANEDGFVCKPLTSQFHFLRLFDKAPKIVLMSATIQDNDVKALGITDYEFIRVPNSIPAAMRPIYNLNCPPITNKSSLVDRKKHARMLSDVINKSPDWYTTLVLFPSKAKTEEWANWFVTMTRRPIFVPERNMPTDKAYSQWLEFMSNNTGTICAAWQFWTGVDAGYLNTVIMADPPFPNFSDPYEHTRFNHNKKQARTRIGNMCEQGQGRNRRGDNSHYGPNAEKLNYVCGGNKWDMIKSVMQKDFLQSIF